MQFNSVEFIFGFLPLFLIIYYLFPEKWRNGILLFGSIAFLEMSGKTWHVALLLGLTVLTYLAGILLSRYKDKWLLTGSLVVLFGCLGFFKYYRGGRMLPPGLSFYLFQMTAYLVDVYRSKVTVEHRLVRYGTQIVMFPKLLSGPLMNPAQLQRQTWGRGYLYRDLYRGVQDFIMGLALKALLADRMAGLWNQAAIIGYKSISPAFAWMALLAFALRLYFDFFGYSLMAIGVGRMLGFELPQNFDHPYAAKSVSEFYRRWHMTLGAWFRDYLYIPLGGSRNGTARTIINLSVVWLATGIWHGIGGNYMIWAGFLLLLIINEKLWLGKRLQKSRILCHVYTPLVILLSWVPFAVGNFAKMKIYLSRLIGLGGHAINPMDFVTIGKPYWLLLAAGVLLATPLPGKIWNRIRNSPAGTVITVILFWLVVFFLTTAKQDPFMYFQY